MRELQKLIVLRRLVKEEERRVIEQIHKLKDFVNVWNEIGSQDMVNNYQKQIEDNKNMIHLLDELLNDIEEKISNE